MLSDVLCLLSKITGFEISSNIFIITETPICMYVYASFSISADADKPFAQIVLHNV